MNRFNLQSLNARRVQTDLLFMYKVFNGLIDSSYLLECFYVQVPSRATRHSQLSPFWIPRGRVRTIAGSVFVRGPRSFNLFVNFFKSADVFNDTIGRQKKSVVTYTKTLPIFL